MKTLSFLHLAEPRLGEKCALAPARSDDRLGAFSRALELAAERALDAVLIGGSLLAPGPLDPALFAATRRVLERARDARLRVILTCERGESGWLAGLAGLVEVLEGPLGDDGRPPTAKLGEDVRVVGLGRPANRTELRRRLEAQASDTVRGMATVALVDAGAAAAGTGGVRALEQALEAPRGVAYVALGGAHEPLRSSERIADPGPLTRLDLASAEPLERAPGFFVVTLQRSRPSFERIASGDPPLHVLSLDAGEAATSAALTAMLASRVAQLTPPVLVWADVLGIAGFDPAEIDETALAAAARNAGAHDARVRLRILARTSHGDLVEIPGRREDLERSVLGRLATAVTSPMAGLASEVYEALAEGSGDALARAAERIARYVDAGGTPSAKVAAEARDAGP